jgi:hypothetical protein
MTKLVERAIAAISQLPTETQDDLARLMLALAEGAPTPLALDEAAHQGFHRDPKFLSADRPPCR